MPTLEPSDAETLYDDGPPVVAVSGSGSGVPLAVRPHDGPADGIPPTNHPDYTPPGMTRKAPPPEAVVTASIYLSDESAADEVKAAFTAALRDFDIVVDYAATPVIGSWFQRFGMRVRSAFHEPAVTERLAKLERALEIQLVDKPQSQVNAADGSAVAGLIAALDRTDNAMITIGSILLVKVDGLVAVRNLGVSELRALERNPSWTMNPGAAMRYLQELQDRDRAAADRVPALEQSSPDGRAASPAASS